MASETFWATSVADLLAELGTARTGLGSSEAARRLLQYGPNTLHARRRTDTLSLLFRQFNNPIILILIAAAGLSLFLHDRVDAAIILGIVTVSGLLGFWQERGATDAVEKLLAIVQVEATVLRDGLPQDVRVEAVVRGDVIRLSAGDIVPGDCLLLESNALFVDEATLTGETYPVEKEVGLLPPATPLAKRTNSLFMGTHVVSGTAAAVVVHTARDTEFGRVSERLRLRAAETEFEHGVRRFGHFLLEVTLVMVLGIFAVNVYLHRPVLDSFLFSMALAVGLTPQLLPAIISINLAHGAKRMAQEKVIVKRLAAIENLGSMNVLCSDKTGTLTRGNHAVTAVEAAAGHDHDERLAIAAAVETPDSGGGFFWSMILIGLYVGVIPVTLGMLALPVLRRGGRKWTSALIAFTVGLLGFLALRPGDVEADYFTGYTPRQLHWRDARAEDAALRDAHWLHGAALSMAAIAQVVLLQVGQVVGYLRARHVLLLHAPGGAC